MSFVSKGAILRSDSTAVRSEYRGITHATALTVALLLGSTVLAQLVSQLRFQTLLQSTLSILKRSAYAEQLSSQGLALYSRLVYSTAQAGTHLSEDGVADRLLLSLCSGNRTMATVPPWQEGGELPCRRLFHPVEWRWGEVGLNVELEEVAPPLLLRFKVLVPWYGYPTLILNAIFFCLLALLSRWLLRNRRERARIERLFARLAGALDVAAAADPAARFQPWSGEAAVLFERRIHALRRDLDEAQAQRIALQTEAGLGKLAAQVAHDIRSPLTVLQLLMEQFPTSDSRYRLLAANAVRRIQSIASDIASNYRESARARLSAPLSREPLGQALLPLVEDIVNEKRLEASARRGLTIEPVVSPDEAFARIDAGTFKRVVSNLVNNAMEALSGRGGNVRVSIVRHADIALLEISDDGPGIPEELLGRLGERGASMGKHEGLGLGLHHARESVLDWGGRLEILSEPGAGTRIRILLPAIERPSWHVSRIGIAPGTRVSILDDDELIHGLWAQRWEELRKADPALRIDHYLTLDRYDKSERAAGRELLLIDQEFLGTGKTGLDFIEERGLAAMSILVTSAYDEAGIIARCIQLGVGLLPKPMIPRVRLELGDGAETASLAARLGQNNSDRARSRSPLWPHS